jgi:hypothetical protein
MRRNAYFISLFAFVLACAACDRNLPTPGNMGCTVTGTGDTISLSYNNATPLFVSCYHDLNATVTKIMDSRCPKGAECVWAGTVSAILQLDAQFSMTLDIGKQKDTVYNSHKLSFTLVNVLPYPDMNSPAVPNDAKAIVRIIER